MKNVIKDEMVKSMKSKNSQRLGVIRLINGKVSDYIKEKGSEDNVISVLDSMVKERNGSISEYIKAGRTDLADVEQYEIDIISEFLPKRLSLEEISVFAKEVIETVGATEQKHMGKVLGPLRKQLGDTAKSSDISQVVKQLLTS